jgi:hypothetical protein
LADLFLLRWLCPFFITVLPRSQFSTGEPLVKPKSRVSLSA